MATTERNPTDYIRIITAIILLMCGIESTIRSVITNTKCHTVLILKYVWFLHSTVKDEYRSNFITKLQIIIIILSVTAKVLIFKKNFKHRMLPIDYVCLKILLFILILLTISKLKKNNICKMLLSNMIEKNNCWFIYVHINLKFKNI